MLMKGVFTASLCRKGLLGGLLYVKETELLYCTNKLTVPESIRRLHMEFSQIRAVEKAPFYTVLVTMKNGEQYRFLVFGREKLLKEIPRVPF